MIDDQEVLKAEKALNAIGISMFSDKDELRPFNEVLKEMLMTFKSIGETNDPKYYTIIVESTLMNICGILHINEFLSI